MIRPTGTRSGVENAGVAASIRSLRRPTSREGRRRSGPRTRPGIFALCNGWQDSSPEGGAPNLHTATIRRQTTLLRKQNHFIKANIPRLIRDHICSPARAIHGPERRHAHTHRITTRHSAMLRTHRPQPRRTPSLSRSGAARAALDLEDSRHSRGLAQRREGASNRPRGTCYGWRTLSHPPL